jgi:hypothetical protein
VRHHEYDAKTSVDAVRRRAYESVAMVVERRVETPSMTLCSRRARSCCLDCPTPSHAASNES